MPKKSLAKIVVFIGVFIALDVLLTRPFRMIGSTVTFGFMAMSVAGGVLGPVLAGVTAMLSDIVGFFAFPQGLTYFVGFALTGVARAVVYGLFYYKKTRVFAPAPDAQGNITQKAKTDAALKTLAKAALCSFIIYILNIFTIPFWYTMILPGTYWGFFAANILSYTIAFFVQTVMLCLIFRYLDGFIRNNEI
ncbi:MAG: hypothetical protein ACOYU3_05970 [Bacillota bacterium]